MIAVIPTLGLAPQLPGLVDELFRTEYVDRVLLVSNAKLADESHAVIKRLDRKYAHGVDWLQHEQSIYWSWRLGIDHAEMMGQSCAVLNDDIEISPHALRLADAALHCSGFGIVGLDYSGVERPPRLAECHGTYRHGGIGGWAFVVNPTKVPEGWNHGYRWWFGDDSLVLSVEDAGHKVGIMEGAHVLHHTSTTADQSSWTEQAKGEDAALFREHWGNR